MFACVIIQRKEEDKQNQIKTDTKQTRNKTSKCKFKVGEGEKKDGETIFGMKNKIKEREIEWKKITYRRN